MFIDWKKKGIYINTVNFLNDTTNELSCNEINCYLQCVYYPRYKHKK